MNDETPKPCITNDLSRCQYRTRTGRRCRHAASDSETGMCSKHVRFPRKFYEEADFSTQLVCGIDEFRSAEDINHVLGELFKLLAADRITPRRGAVMAYTCSLLLRTLPAIERQLNPPDKEPDIIFDLPRPKFDEPEDPERAMYKRMAEHYGRTSSPNSEASTAPEPVLTSEQSK